MNAIKKTGVWIKRVTTAVSLITYAGFCIIMLLIVTDVILRKAANAPISGTYEIVQYTLMSSIFASFAYCQSERGHIHITMFIRLMPQKLRFAAYSVTGLISTAVAGYLSYAGVRQAQLATFENYISGVLRFRIFPFFWIMAVTMFVFTVALFYDVIRSGIAMFNNEFAEEIQKDWS
ncbi:MAG: TRAP transporter small permease [Oscillospiraceae bacterium]|nr:TRAP transporter small permease [Oscillospiraceae bacterium]